MQKLNEFNINNTSNDVQISIIIPTKNRLVTLKHTLKTVLNDNYQSLKVYIIDNNSSDETENYVKNINDNRIVYFNTKENLSMSDNWEFGLSKIKSGYVSILGSDDGHLHNTCSKVNYILKNNNFPDALMSKPSFYIWPSHKNKKSNLIFSNAKGLEWRNSKIWFDKFMNGFIDIAELPTLYTGGFISYKLIYEIKNSHQNKKFYHSSIPDVYSALAITSKTKRFLYCHEPLAINGISIFSNGVSAENFETKKKGSPSNLFLNENTIPYHSEIILNDKIFPQLVHAYRLESIFQSNFLRKQNSFNEKTFWKKNIKILISETILENKMYIFEPWLKKYCEIKNLNFSEIRFFSIFYYLLIKFKNLKRSFLDALHTTEILSNDGLCQNVYEASILIKNKKYMFKVSKIKKIFLWSLRIFPSIKKVMFVR